MKKTILPIVCAFSALANEDLFNQALEYENQGKYKKAMQIYKSLALKEKQKEASLEKSFNFEQNTSKEKKLDDINPKNEALANYLGTEKSYNPFGISTHNLSYFMPVSYSFSKRDYKSTETKFQVSLKKTLFENLLGLNESYNIGYTQISWWQLYKHSAPFRETNYLPEFFINFPISGYGAFENLKDIRIGLLHESNGQNDPKSRSWNRIYLSNAWFFGDFMFIPRVWLRIPEKSSEDDNPDIEKYLGNFDINLAYTQDDYFINILWRNNLNFANNRGAVEISGAYKISNNGLYIYTQYFNGYGESLIEYNKSSSRLSSGILLMY
ncbi:MULTISPECIES: phospholipase A [Campylobacter]|uniref:phospholipase A n=1 Tax=Campylobacter TaxID=194 RepID=UPI0010593A37|nr:MULTISPECIES: phospholipase A [Campylobacter]EAI4441601.1 phospholipase [Campylobacter lari]EAI4448647.1 phospholipase [Campylobacter lari]EAI4449812.1 phospholipase [Campylobacter lari]EAJ5678403.1 phospholipase [Campylobacter lari]EAK0441601.1 phospholipase [Campylobacter lari]